MAYLHLIIYNQLPEFKTTEQFLAVLAKRLRKLKKKGVPNRDTAARKVLYDWNTYVDFVPFHEKVDAFTVFP